MRAASVRAIWAVAVVILDNGRWLTLSRSTTTACQRAWRFSKQSLGPQTRSEIDRSPCNRPAAVARTERRRIRRRSDLQRRIRRNTEGYRYAGGRRLRGDTGDNSRWRKIKHSSRDGDRLDCMHIPARASRNRRDTSLRSSVSALHATNPRREQQRCCEETGVVPVDARGR